MHTARIHINIAGGEALSPLHNAAGDPSRFYFCQIYLCCFFFFCISPAWRLIVAGLQCMIRCVVNRRLVILVSGEREGMNWISGVGWGAIGSRFTANGSAASRFILFSKLWIAVIEFLQRLFSLPLFPWAINCAGLSTASANKGPLIHYQQPGTLSAVAPLKRTDYFTQPALIKFYY